MAHSGRYITSYNLAGQARGSATESCHASEASRIEAMAIVHCGVIYDSGDGWKQTSAVVGMPRHTRSSPIRRKTPETLGPQPVADFRLPLKFLIP